MFKNHRDIYRAIFIALLLTASIAPAVAGDGGLHATAYLKDAGGNAIGIARFTENDNGPVHVDVRVKGLTPGPHGIHIHERGLCEPDFAAAGAHYNPKGLKHGLSNPQGAHAGDLPEIIVNEKGDGSLNTTTDRVTLSPGPSTLFTENGTALVVHAKPDDQRTDPTGNSGDRIACGKIVKAGGASAKP